MHWLADAIVHEISTLADAVESVPISVDGTVRYDFASAHDVLISFETYTCFLDMAIDHIISTDRDGNIDANAIVVSIVSVETDALNSIEDFVISA